MQDAIRNLEPGSLLVEDSKLKMDPNASVCFDIPGSRKKGRRAIWVLMSRCSALMRRRRIRMRTQMMILRAHMEMTLCLRQCYRRGGRARRLEKCNQAPRRRSRWRRSKEREAGREAGREGGREGGRKAGRQGGREGGREREGGYGREGEGGREGGRERGRTGRREGGR